MYGSDDCLVRNSYKSSIRHNNCRSNISKDEILNILQSEMPDLNDIQQKAVDRVILYIEHSSME